MTQRKGTRARKTRETDIHVEWILDGRGEANVETGIPFFDHLLDSLTRHGLFDLTVRAKGDLHVDQHHTVEDVGIVMGEALRDAIGDGAGLRRFGSARIPMADALLSVDLDVSNRPYFVWKVELPRDWVGQFDAALVEDFLYAFISNAGIDLHVRSEYGHNTHHVVEGIFKGLGRALDAALSVDPRIQGALSTKGSL